MRPSELGEWAAFFRINPWGQDRADLRSAIVASLIANAHRDTKKRRQPFSADDFMPYAERPEPQAPTPRDFIMRHFGHLVREKPKETDK